MHASSPPPKRASFWCVCTVCAEPYRLLIRVSFNHANCVTLQHFLLPQDTCLNMYETPVCCTCMQPPEVPGGVCSFTHGITCGRP